MFSTNAIPSNQFRHEIKLPLQRLQYQEFAPALIRMGLYPRRSYGDRQVHSIYLDTPEFDDYYGGVSGLSRRSKKRFRWYDDDSKNMVLEVKKKSNKISQKDHLIMNNPSGVIPRDRYRFGTLNSENAEQLSAVFFSLYEPTLEVSYKRSYFTLQSEIRMTIDRKIQYRKLFPVTSWRMTYSPVDYVVEFKFPVGNESDFSILLQDLPFRLFRHSKYTIGIDTVAIG